MTKSKDFKFIVGMLILIFAVCLYAFWDHSKNGSSEDVKAVIIVDGKEVMNIELDGVNETFEVTGEKYVTDDNPDGSYIVATFQKDENGIRFIDSQCPDHICENTGYCLYEGDTAICMPGKITLVIE